MVPIYFGVFYGYIKHFDVKTPGRDDSDDVVMLTKADYNASKGSQSPGKGTARDQRVANLIVALGGVDNLTSVDACITRLRLDVKDRSAVNDDALRKDLGAAGVVGKGKNVQVIFGAEADIFKTEIKNVKKGGKGSEVVLELAAGAKAPAAKPKAKTTTKKTPAKKVAAKKPTVKKATTTRANKNVTSTPKNLNLNARTVTDLKSEAKKLKITGYSRMNKNQLITAIRKTSK
jgi:glucose-like phosphotransferase system IIB component